MPIDDLLTKSLHSFLSAHHSWGSPTVALLPIYARPDQQNKRKLPDQASAILAKATTFELYSLEPNEAKKAKDKSARLHGWKVLGKTTVKRTDKVGKELLASLDKAVGEALGGAKCFDPRHAIHAEYDGESVDVLICFECRWVYIYFDGKKEEAAQVEISRSAKPIFDKALRDAKVPLAKTRE